MAVEILLKNVSGVHPDPDIDRISSLKRGDLVYSKDIPHDGWNEYETLPEFARVIVSDETASGINQYIQPWYLDVGFTNEGYDAVNDIYTVSMHSNTPGVGHTGAITLEDVLNNLENWGLTLSGVYQNEIWFEADVREIALSNAFWNGINDGLVITPVSFDSQNKIHTMKVSYSGYAIEKSRVAARSLVEAILLDKGATITRESIYGQLMEITLPSATIIDKCKTAIVNGAHRIVFARRYYINTGGMNGIEAYMQNNNGDAMTVTRAQLQTYVNDRLNEY